MEREEVVTVFNNLLSGKFSKVCFSKGYKIYEDTYEQFKEYGLERQEKDDCGNVMVTITLKRR